MAMLRAMLKTVGVDSWVLLLQAASSVGSSIAFLGLHGPFWGKCPGQHAFSVPVVLVKGPHETQHAMNGGFLKLGYHFGDPHDDYSILESILGSPYLGKLPE